MECIWEIVFLAYFKAVPQNLIGWMDGVKP
jgi:hypothetical protein